MSDVTETCFGNIRDIRNNNSNHPYDGMTIQKLIEAADDAVDDALKERGWCVHAALVRELVWRIENEDNRDPINTGLGSYYRFPPEEGKSE